MNDNLINLNADSSIILKNGFVNYCQDNWIRMSKLSNGDDLIVIIYNDKTIKWVISDECFMKPSKNLNNQDIRIKLLVEAYDILRQLEEEKILLIK